MRLLICAGGTGGGVYPALTALRALQTEALQAAEPLEVLWVGGIGGMEADLVKASGIPFEAIPAAGVHGVGWRNLPRNLLQVGRGVISAAQIMRKFRPDVIFFTGGYIAVPVALAGTLPGLGLRRPRNLLYVPDVEPGLALKTLARFADAICLSTENSRRFFTGKRRLVVTGYPTRPEFASWQQAAGRQALGLANDKAVLLVFGGSKGSRSINAGVLSALPELLKDYQVLHITGQLDWPVVEQRLLNLAEELPQEQRERYHAYPYLHAEMGAALASADLALCRAGASTLGELPLFGLPAVLVPYPYAWQYQQVNAQYLAEHGAAVILQDAELAQQLFPLVDSLLRSPKKLQTMRQAMRSLAQPQAAQRIALEALTLARSARGAS